jgi:hypothetical protein
VTSLQSFQLADLAPYTLEQEFPPDASDDHRLFYVGRDDVHGVLMHLFGLVTQSIYLNMFGYDDDDLNRLIMNSAENPNVLTMITLDKSQAGGVHEKAILASDAAADPAAYQAHFAIGQSATHQISHTKGGVLDGAVGFEGSTNWSASGEGTIPLTGTRKAQNNTLLVFTDPRTLLSFKDELVHEHQVVVAQGGTIKAPQATA